LSILTETLDWTPVSKFTGTNRAVYVETRGETKTEDIEGFIHHVYESLRNNYENAASLKTDKGKYNLSV